MKSGIPDFLKKPKNIGHKYGELRYENGRFILTGESVMLEFAKRIFPGAIVIRRHGELRFGNSFREFSDLNWLMMRFPLEVKCGDKLELTRMGAVHRWRSRESGEDLVRTRPPSEFLGAMFPYQEEAVTFLTTNRRALLGDSMGLGKTWSTLGAAAQAGKYPVLIVCQTHVQLQWQRVVGALFDMECDYRKAKADTVVDISVKRGKKLAPILRGQKTYEIPNTPFVIIHYGLLSWWSKRLLSRRFPVVIFDEIQELRHEGTQKYSAASLLSGSAEYVWGASGTPVYGYGAEIWSVMNILDYHCLGGREAFTREWCEGYGGQIVLDPKALNGYLVREGLLLRRKYTDIDMQLPKVVRTVQDLEQDDNLYNELIESAKKKAEIWNAVSFTDKGRLSREIEGETRQAAGIAKATYVADFVASLIDGGERPLIYAWHHAVYDILQECLGRYDIPLITGKQTQKAKDDAVKRFIRGDSDALLMSLRSASGLDGLQARATCTVFAELDWSPAVHCFDDRTEILTPGGFRGVDDVFVGDDVAAFDPKNGEIKWMKANAKIDRRLSDGERVFLTDNKKISLAVTGDHRMVFRRLRRTVKGTIKSGWEVDSAENIAGVKRRYVPICGLQKAKGVDLIDAELELIGLYISDGYFSGNRLVIYQNENQPWNKDIIKIFRMAGVDWSVWKRRREKTVMNWYSVLSGARGKVGSGGIIPENGWRSFAGYLDKDLSPLLEECTRDQLLHLIRGIWLGDGVKKDYKIKKITNTNKTMLDRLQSLCVRRGLSARISERKSRTSAGRSAYDIHIGEEQDAYLQDKSDRTEAFSPSERYVPGDRVWCVSNDLGTLVTRRNGKVVITGNSQAETRIARIGVNEKVKEVPSCYCVSRSGFDEIILDVLGVKTGQFKGIMGDEPEDHEEKRRSEQRAASRIKMLVDKLNKG